MTYLGGSLAGMTADRNLWKSRADQAWGRNRIWNNGPSWESEFNTSQTNLTNMTNAYNAMVAERDAWIVNYNNAIASRDYWQHTVAHNDANVWDNRYNAGHSAGYAAGAGSKSTSAVGAGFSGSSNNQDMAGLTAPRTGLAHVSAVAIFHLNEGGPDAHFHFFRNGGQVINGPNCAGSWDGCIAAQGNIQVNQGDYITVRGQGDQGASWHSGYFLMTVGSQ